MGKKLEVRNLTISFRTNNGMVQAVRNISFDLMEGETLAIAGESGSGKSVTTRAVMGILAGNAVVEGGEILYNGRDLLKIPEEEFHTLRGHRLSMVFQDPLSALNPIMRIGKQLTEAMLLSEKERRQEGRRTLEAHLKAYQSLLEGAIVRQGKSQAEAGRAAKESASRLRERAEAAVARQESYLRHREALAVLQDGLEGILAADSDKNRKKQIRQLPEGEQFTDPCLIPREESAFFEALTGLKKGQATEEKTLVSCAETLLHRTRAALSCPQPDGFALLAMEKWGTEDRGQAEAHWADVFAGELDNLRLALAEAERRCESGRQGAAAPLESLCHALEKETLVKKEIEPLAREAGAAVRACISPLEAHKDNLLHVFPGSLEQGLARCFEGYRSNPREEQRYARECQRHERLKARGKFAPSVPPLHPVDTDGIRRELLKSAKSVTAHLKEPISETSAEDFLQMLRKSTGDAASSLPKAAARRRAIALMGEVGIPDPQRRFHQYPFEFSGGMRQRIVIAIALAANPDILICDEPTTALDVTIQAQILELINRLKRERHLSVIFITHDLGVVANMADRLAVMYAGKIVEVGTAEEVFYDPRHPYTWALLSSMPDLETHETLKAIPGTPPNMILPPKGDAFAARNAYAMEIDFEEEPPMFEITKTHQAATWLLDPRAPKAEMPEIVRERIERMRMRKEGQL